MEMAMGWRWVGHGWPVPSFCHHPTAIPISNDVQHMPELYKNAEDVQQSLEGPMRVLLEDITRHFDQPKVCQRQR